MNNDIEKERLTILRQMSNIHTMRKGVVSEYYVTTNLKDGSTKPNGPYYTITSKGADGKTIGEKIPADEVDIVKTDAENYKLFRSLSEQYVQVCEQASKQQLTDNSKTGKLKKNKKSR